MYAIYGNMDPINIPPMLAYIPYMDPMGMKITIRTSGVPPLARP
jgi:hypothetical protein